MTDYKKKKSLLRRFAGFLDTIRKVIINIIFWMIFIGIIVFTLSDKTFQVSSNSVLFLEPQGAIVDDISKKLNLTPSLGSQSASSSAVNIIYSLKNAKTDKNIKSAVFDARKITSCSLANAREIAQAISDFRESGKEIVFYDINYSQTSYYLASFCSTVVIDPLGSLSLPGFSQYSLYFKEGFDKLGIEMNVFRAGEYKSAAEPFVQNSMSKQAKENYLALINELWSIYLDDIAKARKLELGLLKDYSNNPLSILKKHNGNQVEAVLELGLVDKIANFDAIKDDLEAEHGKFYNTLDYKNYLASFLNKKNSNPKISFITLEGDISSGGSGPSIINGESSSQKIRRVADDKSAKALVLRINSGGGGITASEEIRRAVEYCSKEKPVVISMGGVCASGGYWIASAGDLVLADLTTLTGSIGVFAMVPTAQKAMREYLGISIDGVGTGPYAGGIRIDQGLTLNEKELLQLGVDYSYSVFLDTVAKGRDMLVKDVEQLAAGRVFTGKKALASGLVDASGGIIDAFEAAARLANLEKYRIHIVQDQATIFEQLLYESINKNISSFDFYIKSLNDMGFRAMSNLSFISDPNFKYAWTYENFIMY